MPPRKRKADDTDDEVSQPKLELTSSKGRKLNSGATAVANAISKLKYDLKWHELDEETSSGVKPLYYLFNEKMSGCEKIAAFDIDNTIIVTKSGKNFATNNSDWTFFDKIVPKKLKELDDQGFRIIFITNQGGIEKGKLKYSDLKIKFQDILSQLDLPIFIFISTGETHYRKPATEMWTFFTQKCNADVKVDMKKSFYVGDAAGRVANWAPGKKKDFSCSDRMFAHNCGLSFLTPEEFFQNSGKHKFEWGSIDPTEVLKKSFSHYDEKTYHKDTQEMIIMVGPPASGKSTFFKRFLQNHKYISINRDTLQTQAKCLKLAESSLNDKKSICVDNTNPTKKARQEFIELAKKYRVPYRCILMNTQLELCHHLNYLRQNMTKSKVRRIPNVGYNVYKKNYEEPDVSEGFKEIIKIDFVAKFDDDQHENLFKHWTS